MTRDSGEKGGRALCPATQPAEAGQQRLRPGPRAAQVKKSSVAPAQPFDTWLVPLPQPHRPVPADGPAFLMQVPRPVGRGPDGL